MITLYVEALGNAIRAAHGALSYVELDSICALFGLECDATQAAQQALQAAGAIESAIRSAWATVALQNENRR